MATIKKELIYGKRFKPRNAARLAIFDYIERFYNLIRRHSTPGQKSPLATNWPSLRQPYEGLELPAEDCLQNGNSNTH